MKRLYLMITITNRVMGATHFLDFYRAFGARNRTEALIAAHRAGYKINL